MDKLEHLKEDELKALKDGEQMKGFFLGLAAGLVMGFILGMGFQLEISDDDICDINEVRTEYMVEYDNPDKTILRCLSFEEYDVLIDEERVILND